MRFGYIPGQLRKEKEWTQEQLAEKATLHNSYLSSMERWERNISLASLEKAINALEINPMQIFNFADSQVLENRADKEAVIEAIKGMLATRKNEEVKMVYRILKDMLETFDYIKDSK